MSLSIEIHDFSRGEVLLHDPNGFYLLFSGKIDRKTGPDQPPELVGMLDWDSNAYHVIAFATEPGYTYTVTGTAAMAKLPSARFNDLFFALIKAGQFNCQPVGKNGFAIRGGNRLREACECITHASSSNSDIRSDKQTTPAPPHAALHAQATMSIPAASRVQGVQVLLGKEFSYDPFPSPRMQHAAEPEIELTDEDLRGTQGPPTIRPGDTVGGAASNLH